MAKRGAVMCLDRLISRQRTAITYAGSTLLAAVLYGCMHTSREVAAMEPVVTRAAVGTPDAIAKCVQEYLEDNYGGLMGRMGGLAYEQRRDNPTLHLLGRIAIAPANVRFDLALTPTEPNRVEVRLRMTRPHAPQLGGITKALDTCAPQPK